MKCTSDFYRAEWSLLGLWCDLCGPHDVCVVCSGEPLPQRPTRQQGSKSFRFDAVLADQHTAEDGSQYMHFTFNRGRESGAIIDAEFLLLTGLFTCLMISP